MSARRSWDAVAAARERLDRTFMTGVFWLRDRDAFEAAIRTDEQAKQRALLRAVERALTWLDVFDSRRHPESALHARAELMRAQRRARTEGQ